MIYCFDTYYFDNKARTACLGISSWNAAIPDFELIEITTEIQDYESGSFYKRELPCIVSILEKIELKPTQDLIIVDGFVVLDDQSKLGLGGYLFEYLKGEIPIIGVAKNNFATLHNLKRDIHRGESKKPLYITALGIDLEEATQHVLSMHGDFRFPTILKLLDQKSRAQ